MPSKRYAKQKSANLLDMTIAVELDEDTANTICEAFELPSAEELQAEFRMWAIIYRNVKATDDDAPTLANIRNALKDIAKVSGAFVKTMTAVDGATINRLALYDIGKNANEVLSNELAALHEHSLFTPATIEGMPSFFDAETITRAVNILNLIAIQAHEDVEQQIREGPMKNLTDEEQAIIKRWRSSHRGLRQTLFNMQNFLEKYDIPFSPTFVEVDPATGQRGLYPKSQAARFVCEILSHIDKYQPVSTIERAMEAVRAETKIK